ncbi:RNA polymerase factor sigma-54 [Bacillus sp. OxB-1]|uniref:RNA polymerase factor sigma-54 n=1 Tax=Bacillus sp. (strain OxB-1) TaxID=98228 RepID=UPI000596E45A|nr:RNA polymerase factor sigma-54 [Bacillus sp. OxB-1]
MNVGLMQKQTTQLVMTTELRTAISLLQHSVLELSDYIYEQAISNPLIDLESTSSKDTIIERSTLRTSSKSSSETNDFSPIDHLNLERKTLQDYLLYQAGLTPYPESVKAGIRNFIYSIDENGYLAAPLDELCMELKISAEEGEHILRLIQELEPAGVGARSIQECIQLQLRKLPERNPLAERIIAEHFDEYSTRRWNDIARKQKVTLQDIQYIHDLIQTLDPRPGAKYNSDITNYIVPEVYVLKEPNGLSVILNDDCIPKVNLNSGYLALLQDKQSIDYAYLKEKYEEVKRIQQSLAQRHSTLYKVAKAIVEHQKDFFYEGLKALKPMTLKQVADEIGVHESTISRITTNKYMDTPLGVFELKYFFTAGLGANDATSGEVSSSYLKDLIRKLIDAEDKSKPYSDQDLVSLIEKQEKVSPSRRVIAKYRNELNIPSSSKRKRFAEVHCY